MVVAWRATPRSILRQVDGSLLGRNGRHFTAYSNISAILHPRADKSPSIGDTIRVNGFVRSVRKQKKFAFAAIGDGSTLKPLQAVLTPEQAEG
jgi:hypothetical protein